MMKKEPTVRPQDYPIRLHAECINYVGLRRRNNEDCMCINDYWVTPDEMNQNVVCSQERKLTQALYGVFDGVGGDSHGEMASCTAARFFAENIERIVKASRDQEKMTAIFREANEQVCEQAMGSGTTASVLMIHRGTACVANVGDSGVYLYRDGKLESVFTVHTENGKGEKSHVITRCLGEVNEAQIYYPSLTAPIPLEHGDLFLLCSDGVTDMLDHAQIAAVCAMQTEESQMAAELINLAMEAGGRDNATAMLIRVLFE